MRNQVGLTEAIRQENGDWAYETLLRNGITCVQLSCKNHSWFNQMKNEGLITFAQCFSSLKFERSELGLVLWTNEQYRLGVQSIRKV